MKYGRVIKEGGNRGVAHSGSAGARARASEKRDPGGRVHAYATISFDYIIAFRPGGIIRVNKLHIFFLFRASPCNAAPSFYCRDFVSANSRRLFDPLARRRASREEEMRESGLLRGIILARTSARYGAKVRRVYTGGV